MTNQAKLKIFMLVTFLSGFTAMVEGQIRINSPYTRYGLGNLVENGLDPRTTAMGGLHFGLQRNDLINPANPASYTAFDTMAFVFDAGIFGNMVTLKTDNLNNQGSYISISHLTFGFPITKWWKTSLGLLPFSYVGYDVFHTEELEGITTVTNVYLGSGGLNQIYWGNAFPIGKKLSVGFNLKYMFGSLDRSRGISFPDSTEMKNTLILSSIRPRDIYGEIGIQYKTTLPKDHFLVAGAMFGPQTNINSKIFYMATTYYGDITTAQLRYDTIDYRQDERGNFTLPIRIGLGATAGKARHWTAGADFLWQNWEKYTYDGQSDSLLNRWSVNLGGEYIPDTRSNTYYKRASYRLGFHYGKTPINLKNKHIDELGISFGVGLPIKRSRSTVNLSAIFGKRGTTENGLIQENFFRFTVGVNVLENWFIKSKYF
ncbi:MAG: hypothetical protein K0B08_03065 [Bacteroidales bacterium]|nr:hypothetical protein [Bacteroidales bacterium]